MSKRQSAMRELTRVAQFGIMDNPKADMDECGPWDVESAIDMHLDGALGLLVLGRKRALAVKTLKEVVWAASRYYHRTAGIKERVWRASHRCSIVTYRTVAEWFLTGRVDYGLVTKGVDLLISAFRPVYSKLKAGDRGLLNCDLGLRILFSRDLQRLNQVGQSLWKTAKGKRYLDERVFILIWKDIEEGRRERGATRLRDWIRSGTASIGGSMVNAMMACSALEWLERGDEASHEPDTILMRLRSAPPELKPIHAFGNMGLWPRSKFPSNC